MIKRRMLLAVVAVALMGSSAARDAYVLSTGDNNTFRAASSLDEFQVVQKQLSGRYLWVRRDGRQYVLRDEATIGRVNRLFAPIDLLRPQLHAVGREEAKLDRETDRLSDKDRTSPAERERLAELRGQLRAIERREKELDDRQEELERVAERALWAEIDAAIG